MSADAAVSVQCKHGSQSVERTVSRQVRMTLRGWFDVRGGEAMVSWRNETEAIMVVLCCVIE